MKILLINNYYYARGGAEVHLLALEEMLKSHGHEVTVFSMQNEKNLRNEDFWPEYNDKKPKNLFKYFYNFEAKKCIRKMLENKTFDICHIHNINFHLSFSIISEIKKKNIPIVMTTHDYSIIGPNYNRNKRWNPFHFKNIILIKEFIFRKIFFSFKKNIDAFICPSKFIKNQLESRGFKNLHVIYNFTNISSKEQNSQTDDYFLYFGRLSKEKGLVEFIKILKDLNGDFQFYIVGDGDQRSKIEKLIHKLNFENKIKLLGYKPQDQLFKIIEKAKFIVVPSLCDEVCNMAIIESICLKRPVLAVNLGGNTELSKLDKSVLIYDFKNSKDTLDKINYLMYDNKLTNNINNIFTSAHYYENLVKVYNNALTVNN